MKIKIRVATESGWDTYEAEAPDGADAECYALPKGASRAEFWNKVLGISIPETRGMIWTVVSK